MLMKSAKLYSFHLLVLWLNRCIFTKIWRGGRQPENGGGLLGYFMAE